MDTREFLNFETRTRNKQTKPSWGRIFLGVACVALLCFSAFKVGHSSTGSKPGLQHKAKKDKYGKSLADYYHLDWKLQQPGVAKFKIRNGSKKLQSEFCKRFCGKPGNKESSSCWWFWDTYNMMEKKCLKPISEGGDHQSCRNYCIEKGKEKVLHPGCRQYDAEIFKD